MMGAWEELDRELQEKGEVKQKQKREKTLYRLSDMCISCVETGLWWFENQHSFVSGHEKK